MSNVIPLHKYCAADTDAACVLNLGMNAKILLDEIPVEDLINLRIADETGKGIMASVMLRQATRRLLDKLRDIDNYLEAHTFIAGCK